MNKIWSSVFWFLWILNVLTERCTTQWCKRHSKFLGFLVCDWMLLYGDKYFPVLITAGLHLIGIKCKGNFNSAKRVPRFHSFLHLKCIVLSPHSFLHLKCIVFSFHSFLHSKYIIFSHRYIEVFLYWYRIVVVQNCLMIFLQNMIYVDGFSLQVSILCTIKMINYFM